MLERVLKTISRYNMLAPGDRVVVAVSGGADSVCLFHVLRDLGVTLGGIAHFNHKLRGAASEEDERFVATLAADLGIAFYREECDVGAVRGNLEQAARQARRRFLAGLLRDGVADRIALGHTRDDQAETVLFRLMRGSGLAGLAGIHPVTADGFIRPLIDISRADVEEFLNRRGIAWREDATNRDPRFARNRIRHNLLPQLQREWNPQIAEALAHLADLAYEENRWGGPGGPPHPNAVELRAPTLSALLRAPARRLIRGAISQIRGDLRRIEFDHIESVIDLGSQPAGSGRLRLPGVNVTRSFDWIRLERPARTPPIEPIDVTVPGTYVIPGSHSELRFEVHEGRHTGACANLKVELAWQRIPAPLKLRGWRPGDHYRPVGQSRDQNLKEMFQKARIPSWRRRSWPILTSGEQIVWAKAFGAAMDFAASQGNGPVLRICEVEDGER